jgi:uncharacterized SAM-binding protein YcdF (DUF218 family)
MKSLLRALAGTAGLVLLLGLLAFVWLIWQVDRLGQQDHARPADAIVVLGAAQYDGRPSPVFRARIDHAIDLYRAGVAPTLVVTGGKAEGDRTTEAASARAYALAHGVPAAAILVEDRSRTTLESIRGVARVMADHDLRSAVFVSDPSHMLRVLQMAGDAGIRAFGSPTTTSPVERDPVARLDAVVHELGAFAVYVVERARP